ncbi:SH3 domain signaling protein [Lophium mytilinum]|uniref:SH3 domain signaling protein n=1 Tax=Lophium mytilinum TaxID=390894 RepID=A0A6A6R145_9PEZI|nr:SH3 domain signaling protein [Lophium mytilinum]
MPGRKPETGDVATMLREFEEADQMLVKIAEAAKMWRDAWSNILTHQLGMIEEVHILYLPLGTKEEYESGYIPVDAPRATLERAAKLKEVYLELKTDMYTEVQAIDTRLIGPAKTARESLKPLKKTIKNREDRKLDYERFQGRVDALQKKATRSPREESALGKHEADLAKASYEYECADESLREKLPGINAATFSLLPHLLANQILLQNNLLGNLYTVLHQYSQEQGFPNPPPELEEVIPVWDAEFTPLRKEAESGIELLARGKAVHLPMRMPDQGSTLTGLGLRNKVVPGRNTSAANPDQGSTLTGMGLRNKVIPGRKGSSNSSVPTMGTVHHATSPRPSYDHHEVNEPPPSLNLSNKPSMQSLNASKPKIGSSYSFNLSPASSQEQWGRRTSSPSATNGQNDYFAKPRIPSASAASPGFPNPAVGKKKPPPPPPPKKIGSYQGEYVTAMYDFVASTQGDLAFREGDRIKVTKKTQSSQDWWEGELNGQKGSFPANYCK